MIGFTATVVHDVATHFSTIGGHLTLAQAERLAEASVTEGTGERELAPFGFTGKAPRTRVITVKNDDGKGPKGKAQS